MLTNEQLLQMNKAFYRESSRFATLDSVINFASKIQADIKEVIEKLKKVTGCTPCLIRYEAQELKGFLGIMIHQDFDTLPRELWGRRYEIFNKEGVKL